ELLLELAARPVCDLIGVIVDLLGEEGCDLLGRRHLAKYHGFGCAEQEVLTVALDSEPAVAAHRVANLLRDTRRHRKLGVAVERRHYFLGRVPGGARVPESEPRDAIRVNV